ncbi:hypothetical protein GEV39_08645 [Pseudomonas sp. NY5710]|nr:hypothetical protein GEV39_08645 [Pseudomonas sp. NY5710]
MLGGFSGCYWILLTLCRPFRGLARSHRYCTGPDPVGAGKPAKGPAQAVKINCSNAPAPATTPASHRYCCRT